MNRGFIVLGCICLFCMMSSNAYAFLLSPSIAVETTISDDTMAIFVGETELDAIFYGYRSEFIEEMIGSIGLLPDDISDEIIDTNLLSNLHVLPLFGMTKYSHVDRVQVVNIETLQGMSGSMDLIEIMESIQVFSDVDIILQSGLALFGTDGTALSIDYSAGLSFSGLLQMPLTNDEIVNILGMISEEPVNIGYNGTDAIIHPYSEDISIVITDQQGNVLLRSTTQEVIYLLEDDSFVITDDSSVHLFPLDGSINHGSVELLVQPAQLQPVNIDQMLGILQNLSDQMGNMSVPFISDENSMMADLLPVLSNIVNGGFIVVNTSVPVDVDDTIQYFSDIGFARSESFTVVIPEDAPSVRMISGDFRMVFLGDHFYSPQAPHTSDGVSLPLLPILLWATAAIFYFLFKYLIHSRYPDRSYPVVKQFGLYLYIVGVLAALIILDRTISYQFGSSMFDILFSQGFNLAFLAFLGLELLLFGLGFLLCAVPTSWLINQILHYFGFKQDTRAIGKVAGTMMIWVFAAIYATVIFNIVFLFIQLPSFGI